MKRIFTILVAVLLLGSISAQAQFKYGVKGGLNLAKINSTDPVVVYSNRTGFHGGFMAEIKLPIVGIEVDALYSQTGSKVDIQGAVNDLKNSYIAIPVVAKLYFLKVLNFQVGPTFSWLASTNIKDIDPQGQLTSDDLQIVFGVGAELAMLHASLRYNLGVKDVNASTTTQSFDLKNNAVQLSVGIWLNK